MICKRPALCLGEGASLKQLKAGCHRCSPIRSARGVTMTWPQYLHGACIVDGRREGLSPHEAEILFALLVHRPDRFLSRAELIEFLYPDPDREPDYASTNITIHLSRLRKLGITIESRYPAYRTLHDRFGGYRIPEECRASGAFSEPKVLQRRR